MTTWRHSGSLEGPRKESGTGPSKNPNCRYVTRLRRHFAVTELCTQNSNTKWRISSASIVPSPCQWMQSSFAKSRQLARQARLSSGFQGVHLLGPPLHAMQRICLSTVHVNLSEAARDVRGQVDRVSTLREKPPAAAWLHGRPDRQRRWNASVVRHFVVHNRLRTRSKRSEAFVDQKRAFALHCYAFLHGWQHKVASVHHL